MQSDKSNGYRVLSLSPSGSTDDDFSVIQQEIVIVKGCKHSNIVAYYGSYIRWVVCLSVLPLALFIDLMYTWLTHPLSAEIINCGFAWSSVEEAPCRTSTTVSVCVDVCVCERECFLILIWHCFYMGFFLLVYYINFSVLLIFHKCLIHNSWHYLWHYPSTLSFYDLFYTSFSQFLAAYVDYFCII